MEIFQTELYDYTGAYMGNWEIGLIAEWNLFCPLKPLAEKG